MTQIEALKTAINHIDRAIAEPNNTMSDGKALKEIMRQLNLAKAVLREALAEQPAQQDEYGYAKRLAEWLWQKHYAKDAPDWVPFDNLAGVLTQIDNMVCRLVKEQPAQQQDYWQEEARRYAQNADFWRVKYEAATAQQQELVAYDKTELNCFAQDLYDQKMREGKHGHYESMFHVIHQCIKKVAPPASKPWVGLTNQELLDLTAIYSGGPLYCAIEAKLREKNA